MKAMINAFRETINYMMTSKMHVERRTIDLSINVTQLDVTYMVCMNRNNERFDPYISVYT
jgi:hypothetical protein